MLLPCLVPDLTQQAISPLKLRAFVCQGKWSLHNGATACFSITMFSLLMMEWDYDNSCTRPVAPIIQLAVPWWPAPSSIRTMQQAACHSITGCILKIDGFCASTWAKQFWLHSVSQGFRANKYPECLCCRVRKMFEKGIVCTCRLLLFSFYRGISMRCWWVTTLCSQQKHVVCCTLAQACTV